jgi:predicted Zn-dependent protease
VQSAAFHILRGETETAEQILQELLQEDPVLWVPQAQLGLIARFRGDTREAIRRLEKVREQDPMNIFAIFVLMRAYMDAGDLVKARAILENTSKQDRANYYLRLAQAILLALEGKRADALREMDSEVLKYAELSPFVMPDAAEFYAVLGEKEKACEWLDRAVRAGVETLEWYQRDPLLASLRNNQRFKQILDSIAFRRQQRQQDPANKKSN